MHDYRLLDAGDYRRIEDFSGVIVDRPCPPAADIKARIPNLDHDYRFSDGRWSELDIKPWVLPCGSFNLELRAATGGQVGVFPEQAPNWVWIDQQLRQVERPIKLLNCFAYTGAASLAAAATSKTVKVTHLDGAKVNVNWAKRNADLSQINHIRWIVDDVMSFLRKEQRRGVKYDAIIADPPAFGRGPKGRWSLRNDLGDLLAAMATLLSDDPAFVLLSGHAPDLSLTQMTRLCESHFPSAMLESLALDLNAESGVSLRSSDTVRCVF